jgi:hypothetical protein
MDGLPSPSPDPWNQSLRYFDLGDVLESKAVIYQNQENKRLSDSLPQFRRSTMFTG